MKMLAKLKMVLLLCVGASLAQDLMNIEERLKATEQTLEELKRENEALRIITKESKDKLESLLAEKKAKQVAFSAGLLASGSGNSEITPTPQTLIYQKIFTNTGNAYDSNTGIFTAPVNGVYFFRFYAHSHTGYKVAVTLIKNGQVQCSVYAETTGMNNGNASNGVVLTLVKGDQVYTQLWGNSWVFDDGNSYTSFSGFLLFSM